MLINNYAKLSHSSRNAVSASMVFIVIIAMYNWMVAPRAKYLSAAQRYGSAMDSFVNKNKVIQTRVKLKKKELEKLQEKAAKIQSTLFTPDKAREFFSDLQAIAQQTGCIVYSVNRIVNYQNPADGKLDDTAGIVTRSAVLSVVGVYKNISRLIETLQSRTEKVWIDSIKLRTLNYSSDKPRCDITITICTLADKEHAL
jgi:hypothetical protein